MPDTTAINKVLKRLLAASAIGVGSYGGYQVGKHVGSKKTQKEMNEIINNQQIANEYYLRGLQEGNVEKTAQMIAKELLEKNANVKGVIGRAGRWLGGQAQELGTNAKKMFAEDKKLFGFDVVNKETRRAAMKNVLKNPLTIGAAGIGMGGLMAKESSDKSSAATNLLEKIAHIEECDNDFEKEASFKNLPKAAKQALKNIRARASKGYKGASKASGKGVQAIKKYISKHPSVLTGAGGVAVGAAAGKAMSSNKK